MKKYILYTLLFAGLAASCNTEQFPDSDAKDNYADKSLRLDVKRVDFLDASESGSRVTNSGLVTTFREGDVVGVLVTQDDVNYNLPYKYDGTNWNFDTTKGKDLFIKTSEGALEYIIYYPYTEQANSVTTVEGLKTALPVLDDQSSEANYTASDVLYVTVKSAENEISGTLEHLRSLFAFRTKVKFQTTVSAENEFETCDVQIQNVEFSSDEKNIRLFNTSEGEYRYIVESDKIISWIYEYKDGIYESSKQLTTPEAGKMYVTVESINLGKYDNTKFQAGDMFCVLSGDNSQWYIYPSEFYNNESVNVNCIGIILHKGKHADDNCTYPEELNNNIHGYAMAITDLPDIDANTKGQVWANSGSNIVTGKDVNAWDGYTNTQTIYTQAGENLSNYPLANQCKNFAIQAPSNTSGWFIGSAAQLKYIFTYSAFFQQCLDKVKGSTRLETDQWYWTSTTASDKDGDAIIRGSQDTQWAKTHHCDTRPILTF